MSEVKADELVRRTLPWYVMSRFQNALLSIPDVVVEQRINEKYVKVDLKTRQVAGIFVPGASRFLVSGYVNFEIVEDTKKKQEETWRRTMYEHNEYKLMVNIKSGFVYGFLPNGKYVKFYQDKIVKNELVEVKYKDEYSLGQVADVLRNYLRLSASPLFGAVVSKYAKKIGIEMTEVESGIVPEIIIKEGKLYTRVVLPTNIYRVKYNDFRFRSPGVIASILFLMSNNMLDPLQENPEARGLLSDFIKRVDEVGRSLAGVSGSLLQSTSKSSFTYIIGEVKETSNTANLKNPIGLGTFWINKYTTMRFTLQPSRIITTTITVRPFSSPATVVLNYTPFNIAPLSALMNEGKSSLSFAKEKVTSILRKKGFEPGFYDTDYEVLSDANITFEDVRKILRDGYPKLESLNVVLEKSEKLGYIGDVISHAYGSEVKVDKILIRELTSISKKESKKENEGEEILI